MEGTTLRPRILAALGALLALGAILIPSAASAAPRGHGFTVQCGVTANCVTPDVYASAGPEAVLQATSGAGGSPIVTGTPDTTNLLQDWRYIYYGTVASLTNNGDGPFSYGLTSEDYSLYGTSPVFGLQLAPAGVPTNKCAANIGFRLTLRSCRSGPWQRFIGTPECVSVPLLSKDGLYWLSAVHAGNFAAHDAVTAGPLGGQVSFSFPTGVNAQNWDDNDNAPPVS